MSRRRAMGILALVVSGLIAPLTGCRDHTHDGVEEAELARTQTELCRRWQQLKNARDPQAEELLAPVPEVPGDPVSQREAERLQTDWFLRQDIRIVSVRPGVGGQVILATRGNVSAPTLPVQTATGIDRVQRTMSNPNLIVEVQDGKIRGVRAEMN